MADKKGKKKWVLPKLIVLAKAKQEELVLVACKGSGRTTNYTTHFMSCNFVRTPSGACTGSCSAYGTS